MSEQLQKQHRRRTHKHQETVAPQEIIHKSERSAQISDEADVSLDAITLILDHNERFMNSENVSEAA